MRFGGVSPRLLIVTAVPAERDAAARGLAAAASIVGPYKFLTTTTAVGRVDLLAGGVGVAAAAAATATALSNFDYDLVISAGVAGGFAPTSIGDVVVARTVIEADFGAESPQGFLSALQLGFAPSFTDVMSELVRMLSARTGGHVGTVLTVSTVTGTQGTAAARLTRFPDALAEAMEGAGVLTACDARGVPFAEVRTISNAVGPRDVSAWDMGAALDALSTAVSAITATPFPGAAP